jgi:hypothetical protein
VDVVLEVAGHPVAAHRRSALEVGDVRHVRVVQIPVVVANDRLEDVPEVLHRTTIYYNLWVWIRGSQRPTVTHTNTIFSFIYCLVGMFVFLATKNIKRQKEKISNKLVI